MGGRKPGRLTPESRAKYATQKKAVIEALRAEHGLISFAAKRVGIDRHTISRWIEEDEELRAEVKKIDDANLDFVENKLFDAIAAGGKEGLTAAIFYLKCKGKARGYIERQEISTAGGAPIVVQISKDDAAL